MDSILNKILLTIVTIMAAIIPAGASYPMVTNFNRRSFGGGAQTWAIAQDAVGRMYFGNSNGLVTYDSREWHLEGLPNGSTIRSLLFSSSCPGRLYAGGSEEFGYFEPEESGRGRRYVSLADKLPAGVRSFKEVWAIHELDGRVWFRADNHLFYYDGKKVSSVLSPGRLTASMKQGNRLIVAVANEGLYSVKGGKLKPIEASRSLAGMKVCSLLEYSDKIMVVTEREGLWLLTATELSRFETDIDAFVKNNPIFCAASSGSKFAFGSVGNGVVIKDFESGKISYANIETGTQNNTVLSMSFDRDGNVWLGLDNGIDLLMANAPYSNLLGSSTICGAGYCSHLFDGMLYLGTNQGLYRTPYPIVTGPHVVQPTQIMSSQVWNMEVMAGKLVICSDAGLSVGTAGNFRKIEGIPGAWDAHTLDRHPGYALVSTYNGFYVLQNSGGEWVNRGRVTGYSDIGGRFIEDGAGDIWISHWLKGIYRLRIDPEQLRVVRSTFYNQSSGLPSNRNCAVTRIDGEMIFTTEGGLYQLGADNKFRKNDRLNKLYALRTAARLHQSPNEDVWIVNGDGVSVASRNATGEVVIDSVTYGVLAEQLIPGFDNFNFISDQHVIVSNREGFYDIDLPVGESGAKEIPKSHIVFNRIYADGDSMLYGDCTVQGEEPLKIDYGHNSLRFEYVMPEYRAENAVTYSCYLENYDKGWSGYTTTPSKEYTQLTEGTYLLHVKARNNVTQQVTEAELSFKILPPWYRTTLAKIIYSILIVLTIIGAYRIAIYMTRRETERLARKKEEEMEAMRRRAREEALHKDFQIAELKGRQLEQDIKHKTEELSNITMNVVRKNEILQDISEHLTRLTQTPLAHDVKVQIDKIQQLIRQNMSHDDDWRNFVHNFDVAYEDFTKKLIEMHPTLTRTELRVSCYIRMGLSSKDIAPLFNISHRSVEMTRYRLRKKLDLPREANLTDYLQGIK